MATVTALNISIFPVANYVYQINGLINGSNAITLPAPPAAGSFPPAGDWTPTIVLPIPWQNGAAGAFVSYDPSTIANSSGTISFTLYANGATNCYLVVM